MKYLFSKLILFVSLIVLVGCTEDFEEINTNPLSLSTGKLAESKTKI